MSWLASRELWNRTPLANGWNTTFCFRKNDLQILHCFLFSIEFCDLPGTVSSTLLYYILDIACNIIGPSVTIIVGADPIPDDIPHVELNRIIFLESAIGPACSHFGLATNSRLTEHIKLRLRRATVEIGTVPDIAGVASGAIGWSEAIMAFTDPFIAVTEAHTRTPTFEIQLQTNKNENRTWENSHKS
jgi:hypothetical protein